jgi:hypothetical protein
VAGTTEIDRPVYVGGDRAAGLFPMAAACHVVSPGMRFSP